MDFLADSLRVERRILRSRPSAAVDIIGRKKSILKDYVDRRTLNVVRVHGIASCKAIARRSLATKVPK